MRAFSISPKHSPTAYCKAAKICRSTPSYLPVYDDQTINVSAREKAESFASINAKLGVVQKGALTEAIRAGYAQRAELTPPIPDFQDILAITGQMYEDQGRNDDSLIEILRDLATFNLFWKHGDGTSADGTPDPADVVD
jgi:DNA sulfur modification protein DndE